jgi:hypothetical protein
MSCIRPILLRSVTALWLVVLFGIALARCEVNETTVALARQFVGDAIKKANANAFTGQIRVFNDRLELQMREANPGRDDAVAQFMKLMNEEMAPAFVRRLPQLERAIALAYAEEFDEAELRELLAVIHSGQEAKEQFKSSPLGRKLAGKREYLRQQSRQVGAAWGEQVGRDVVDAVRARGSIELLGHDLQIPESMRPPVDSKQPAPLL